MSTNYPRRVLGRRRLTCMKQSVEAVVSLTDYYNSGVWAGYEMRCDADGVEPIRMYIRAREPDTIGNFKQRLMTMSRELLDAMQAKFVDQRIASSPRLTKQNRDARRAAMDSALSLLVEDRLICR